MNFRYHLLICRREQLALPAALWGLFILMIALMHNTPRQTLEMADAFLGFVLPLMAGILSASAIVDDMALELQFTAPRAPWRTLVERLALILAVVALAAVTFQGYLAAMGVAVSVLGGVGARQLTWLLPSLALMGLSSLAALVFTQGTAGALFVGAVWIIQLILKDWFVASDWARYVFLFMRARYPAHPALLANQLCLLGLAVALTIGASLILRQGERYL